MKNQNLDFQLLNIEIHKLRRLPKSLSFLYNNYRWLYTFYLKPYSIWYTTMHVHEKRRKKIMHGALNVLMNTLGKCLKSFSLFLLQFYFEKCIWIIFPKPLLIIYRIPFDSFFFVKNWNRSLQAMQPICFLWNKKIIDWNSTRNGWKMWPLNWK